MAAANRDAEMPRRRKETRRPVADVLLRKSGKLIGHRGGGRGQSHSIDKEDIDVYQVGQERGSLNKKRDVWSFSSDIRLRGRVALLFHKNKHCIYDKLQNRIRIACT